MKKTIQPENFIYSSKIAQKIYCEKNRINICFKPFIANFYSKDKMFSIICWKSDSMANKKYVIMLADKTPRKIVHNFDRVEYLPLKENDTVIINRKIFTVVCRDDEILVMQLPFIHKAKYAISVANLLCSYDTSNFYWHLVAGKSKNETITYLWCGVCPEDVKKSVLIVVFAEDSSLLDSVEDLEQVKLNSEIFRKDMIFNYKLNAQQQYEIEYLCRLPSGQPS